MTDLHNMVRKVVLNIATTPKILVLQHRVDFFCYTVNNYSWIVNIPLKKSSFFKRAKIKLIL